MPPARTLLRASTTTDFGRHQKNLLKKPSAKTSIGKNKYVKDQNGKKENSAFQNEYMDLDEFFSKKISQENGVNLDDEDSDCRKPNVDLLASLVTLGKMIQDQKDLIERQKQQKVNEPTVNSQTECQVSPVQSHLQISVQNKNKASDENTDHRLINDSPEKTENFLRNCKDNVTCQSQYEPDISSIRKQNSDESCFNSQKTIVDTSPTTNRTLIPEEIKDVDYWDRRKRNNMAAKKSREERRRKELEILEAAKKLEKENAQLATMLKRLTARNELLEARLQTIRKDHLNSSDDNIYYTSSAENSA